MVYPLDGYSREDKKKSRDVEYMKSIYPEVAKQLLPYIEEECDRLEYDGSLIYDEYPDKLLLRLMCSRVHKHAIESMQYQGLLWDEKEQDWLRDLVEILVYQELCRRRECWRCQRKTWY